MTPPQPAGDAPVSRGDIVLVAFPFTDLSATKRRPAVVVRFDSRLSDYTVAFISSQCTGSPAPGDCPVQPAHPEFPSTGLVCASTIRATRLATLSPSLVTRRIGRLGPTLALDLDRALVEGLGISVAPYREQSQEDERARLVALHTAGGAAAVLRALGVAEA